MIRAAVTLRAHGRSVHRLVLADPDSRVVDVFPETAGGVGADGRRLDPQSSLADAGIRDGAVLDVLEPATAAGFAGASRSPATVPVAEPGSLALLITGGPMAGASSILPPGDTAVGRGGPIPLRDAEVSRHHLDLHVGDDGSVTVTDAKSANGTFVAGRPATKPQRLSLGEPVEAGQSVLAVGTTPPADAAVSADGAGGLRYSRPPRTLQPPPTAEIELPAPPLEPERPPFPWLSTGAPVLVGVLMTVLLRQPQYLAFVALSPIMAVGNVVSERRRNARSSQTRSAEHERRRGQGLATATRARDAERDYLRLTHPDPATLVLICTAPSSRLWERQRVDEDFLALCVGTGTIPSAVTVRDAASSGDAQPATTLTDAPVVLSLPACGSVGLAGPSAATRALARSMLLSLATLHSPREVTVTLLAGPDTSGDWDWLRWLPHARLPAGGASFARVGNDEETIRRRIAELTETLESRRPPTLHGALPKPPPCVDVVVIDNSYQLRADSNLGLLLRNGPAAGIYCICLDETAAHLPAVCRGTVSLADTDDGQIVAQVRPPGKGPLDGVRPGRVGVGACETAARALAPVTDVGAAASGTDNLPSSVRFLDLAGLEPPTADRVRAAWRAGGRSTKSLIGVSASGPFTLDLAAGPHALIAGTTGSGKSTLLQTLIASLAVANHPDAMNFVLVDYKGRTAFPAFAALPHTAGMLSDLDEMGVARALSSLRGELQRRKLVLDRAQVSDISAYWALLRARPDADPLPRLVIVVDEFAGMAADVPEQLKSLIDIGMQGRAFGIHLVLATQRPAGVVTAEMRANINLRIALRVASVEESQEVIGSAAAARIPVGNSAGRAYIQLGPGRPVPFQTAVVGGSRPGARPSRAAFSTVQLDWADLGYPVMDRVSGPAAEAAADAATDLTVLVDAIAAAASEEAFRPPHAPWRPPLPELLTVSDITASPGPLELLFGQADSPGLQLQPPTALDLQRGGHLLVAGAPRSGRTTLLRTLAGVLAGGVRADLVHLYAVDAGGGLGALAGLPHCGAVATLADLDRLDRLFGRLNAEVTRRLQLLAADGYGDLAELHAARRDGGPVPPYLMLFLDGYESFATTVASVDNGRLGEQLRRMVREGLAAGLRCVVTGNRGLLTSWLATLAEDKVVLRMADRSDYALVGISTSTVPDRMPSGRAFRLPGAELLQVAVLSRQAHGSAQSAALRGIAQVTPAAQVKPFRVDPLPATISYAQASKLPAAGQGVLVGVGGDELSQVRSDAPCLLAVGPHGSGRSTALAVQARSALAAELPLVLITPRRSILRDALPPEQLSEHLTATDGDAAASLNVALAAGRMLIVIDDADFLADTPVGEVLTSVCRGLRDSGHIILAAATAEGVQAQQYRGLIAELRKAKCGLVMSPTSAIDGEPLGVRLPGSVLGGGVPLRAAFVRAGAAMPVQVPALPDSAQTS